MSQNVAMCGNGLTQDHILGPVQSGLDLHWPLWRLRSRLAA